MILLQRNKPVSLWCIHNPDHYIEWDSDEAVYYVEYAKRYHYLELNERIGEFLVYSPQFDFETIYVGRWEDFDVLEDF